MRATRGSVSADRREVLARPLSLMFGIGGPRAQAQKAVSDLSGILCPLLIRESGTTQSDRGETTVVPNTKGARRADRWTQSRL